MTLRRTGENVLIVLALGIAVFMLAPPTSPVLGSSSTIRLPLAQAQRLDVISYASPEPFKAKERPKPTQARGLLMTGYSAGGSRFDRLLRLIRSTELNAVVVDIKDERGELSWVPTSPGANLVGAGRPKMRDPRGRIARLHRNGVYVIGRIVTFQDNVLAEVRPDLAVRDNRGGIWRTEKGQGWGDPFSTEVQDYNLALAKEALDVGFDEIQFDYVRFPTDGDAERLWYSHGDGRVHTEVIRQFLARARAVIAPRGGYISADLFGLVTLAHDDLGIGQRLELIAREVDYVSLMLYPSHYHKPEYDIPDPEREPYKTVALSIKDAKKRIAGTRAKLRPWIQDFTLGIPYTPVEVHAQIKALEDNGVHEWLLWNANNRYTQDALRPAEA
jgi:hypothetical protein